MKLYRPVGLKELMLIESSGWKAFPPRLVWQPVFYPVLNEDYAMQIAREWNAGDEFSGYCGVVTSFEVNDDFIAGYSVQNVGAAHHDELWIPAEELEIFNQNIVGTITIINAFFGSKFILPKEGKISAALLKFKQ